MLLLSMKTQISIMLKRKEYKVAFLLVLAYACLNFVYVLTEFRGMDLSVIKDANQSVCYSDLNRLWFFFSYLYPFLVVLPFSTSYIDDERNQILPIYLSRSSRKDYYLSKLLACFIGTATVIGIPFLFNLLICNIFLPHNHNVWIGEYQLNNFYRSLLGINIAYETSYPEISFWKLFLYCPFLYNLWYLVLLSLFSGLLGTFVLSLSFWLKKNKIILFLPIYVIMQVSQIYDGRRLSDAIQNGSRYTNFSIMEYIVPSITVGKSPFFILTVLVGFIFVIVCSTTYAIKEDLRSIQ